MAVKDVKILDLVTPATVLTASYDAVNFLPNVVVLLTDATDKRVIYSWAYTPIQKVIVSPVGVAYPGDAAVGTGPKKVTVAFTGAVPPNVVMTGVDNVDFSNGWLVITKGDHVIAYAPRILQAIVVEPS